MAEEFIKNVSVHVSSRSFLNITFNIFQCANYEVESGSRFSTSEDDVFQLFYVNSGAGFLETEAYAAKVRAGSGFVIFPDVPYSFTTVGEEAASLTWVTFSGFRVDHYLSRAAIWPARPVFDDPKGEVGKKLNDLYMKSHRLPNRYCKMMSALYDIFAYLLDNNEPKKPESYKDFKDTANYLTAFAARYVERNYMNPITVDDLANRLGITRKHLCAVFNRVLQITPKQFIILYRIEKACKLLLSSNQSIQEIAEAVGYTNQFYFSKEFKRIVGKSPSEYRNSKEKVEVFSYRSFLSTLMRQYEMDDSNMPGDWKVLITPSRKETGGGVSHGGA